MKIKYSLNNFFTSIKADPAVSIITGVFIMAIVFVGLDQFGSKQLASPFCTTQTTFDQMITDQLSLQSQVYDVEEKIRQNNDSIVSLQASLVNINTEISKVTSLIVSDSIINQKKKQLDQTYSLSKKSARYVAQYNYLLTKYNELLASNAEYKAKLETLKTEKTSVEAQVVVADNKSAELSVEITTLQNDLNTLNLAIGSVTMCTTDEVSLCSDSVDNDGDGTTDCSDSDCSYDSACTTQGCSITGCPGGQTCNINTGSCEDSGGGTEGCSVNGCPTGQVCSNNECVNDGSCSSDSDCSNGENCNGGQCTKTNAVCGNGTVEEGEQCDDGNQDSADGCNSCQNYCLGNLPDSAFICDGSNLNINLSWDLVDLSECEKDVVGPCSYTLSCKGKMNGDFCAGYIDGGNSTWSEMPAPCLPNSTAYSCSYTKYECSTDDDCTGDDICIDGKCSTVRKPGVEGDCFDEVDNDGDGMTDCEDMTDCGGKDNLNKFLPPYVYTSENKYDAGTISKCTVGSPRMRSDVQIELDPSGCSDGLDNDKDGAIDGDDVDCK